MANQELKPQIRPLGGTELSWCRAVPGGTGITVLALLFSQTPDITLFQNALHTLQISHPILRSKLTNSPSISTNDNNVSFLIPPTPHIQIKSIDLSSNSQTSSSSTTTTTTHSLESSSSFHGILEYELNQNVWKDHNTEIEVFFATLYALQNSKWVLVFRVHTSVCDRTSAVTLLTELMGLIGEKGLKGVKLGEEKDEINLAIEDLIPSGKADKPFWSRGADLLGYSLNSFRYSNLDFQDVSFPRSTGVARLQMNQNETRLLLDGCKARGIKLSGAIAAAALIAAYSLKELPDYQWEKYAVVTLVDCREFLDPPLQRHNIGFYHSGILNTHDINEEAELWELASRCYTAVTDAKNSNKHFTDMSDLNYLMCKAIDNPSLTPSTSMRTSLICVFDGLVIDSSGGLHQQVGLEDYVGCSAVHGVGPSIAVFDTIRNGRLDCAFVYPMPLHSREQMQKVIDQMKRTLIDGCDLRDDGLAT